MAARDYSEPTRKALFALSLGRCYEPNCPERVVRMDGEIPIVQVQIAHIRAASDGGPRYDDDMNDDDRRAFSNLLLLCTFHHRQVDTKPTGDRFSVDDLTEWKELREGELSDELRVLTEDGLSEMLGTALGEILGATKAELLSSIERVEHLLGESAQLLRALVDNTFNQPYLDADAVASLASSAHALQNLPDYVPMLWESSKSLQILPDYAGLLSDSSRDLRNLPDYVGMLRDATTAFGYLPDCAPQLYQASRTLINLPDHATLLTRAARDVEQAAARVERLMDAAENLTNRSYLTQLATATNSLATVAQDLTGTIADLDGASHSALTALERRPPDRLTYIRNGMIAGVVITLLVIGAIWFIVAHSSR